MSTPPTGEDPQRGPDPSPTPAPGHGRQPSFAQQPFPPQGQQPPWLQQPHGQQPPFGPPTGSQPGYAPYGQQVPPAWQPGVATKPPRDRTRRRLVVALQLVALAIVVAAATLVYVLSSTILDRSAVERAVAQQFEEREGVALDLQCRHRMIVRPGADYECAGTTADGEEVEIRITITDDDGAYTWAED